MKQRATNHATTTEVDSLMQGSIKERSGLDDLLAVPITGKVATKEVIYCACGIPGGGCYEVTVTVPEDHEPDVDDEYISATPEFKNHGQ